MESRIIGNEVKIDYDSVQSFFNGRTKKKLPHRYNLINYQDDNPERALERDKIEKDKIFSYIEVQKSDFVLDVGCGVGRWADLIVPTLDDGKYIGVDYTEDFVNIAREQFEGKKTAAFYRGAFQELIPCLKENNEYRKYNKVLINGVLMYINDDDIDKCLEMIDELLDNDGIIYLKESVGVNERLTLKDFYSKELTADYNVIYRSVKEYTDVVVNSFIKRGYTLMCCGPTWDKTIDYMAQTANWYWIIRKHNR